MHVPKNEVLYQRFHIPPDLGVEPPYYYNDNFVITRPHIDTGKQKVSVDTTGKSFIAVLLDQNRKRVRERKF